MEYLSSVSNWVVVLSTIAIVGLCVVLHYEVLSICNRYLPVLSHRVMAALGLAYSLYPYVVLDRLTVWDAAAAPESLRFVLVGVVLVVPVTLAYTVFVYRVFRGKVTRLSYGED